MFKKAFILFALTFNLLAAHAGKPVGKFLKPKLLIGDTIRYALSYKHPKSEEVVFPELNYEVENFEILQKLCFATITNNNISADCVIYTLRSFEIQPTLSLALPVFILSGKDSSLLYSIPDSITVAQKIAHLPESLILAEDTTFASLPTVFNYWNFGILIIAALSLTIILLLPFSATLKRRYAMYMINTKQKAFTSRYEILIKKYERTEQSTLLEEAVTLWKNYLTDLEQRPINSFTTKEIAEFYDNEEVSEVLKMADRIIYGNLDERKLLILKSLTYLKSFTEMRFSNLQSENHLTNA